MKYPITYKAELTLSWESRSTIIEIELSDEEVEQIQSVVNPNNTKKTYNYLRKQFPELSSKLFEAGLDFMWYTEYLDARLSGVWKENSSCNVNEQQLMLEDIASNGFDPHNEDGKLLRGQDRYNAWVKWEEKQLEQLPFGKRSSFYEDRYDIHNMEFDENAFLILFPDEIIVPALESWEEIEIPTTEYTITFTLENKDLVPSLRTATIPVSLTDEQVQQIRKQVNLKQAKVAYLLIRERLLNIYLYINSHALDFVSYTELIYKRRCKRYEYDYQDGIKEEDKEFMKEDMEQRGYDPHDEKGVLLEGDALLQHWMDWEEQQLEGMDYDERCDYYFERYGVENDYATSPKWIAFYFPEDFFKQ